MKQFLLFITFFNLTSLTALSNNNSFLLTKNRVNLVQDTVAIADSVNMGYYSVSKNQLTGAVSRISRKQLQPIFVTSVDQALKGQAAGVQVTQNSGMPGAATSVRVRGVSTLFHSAEPLYVIDGVPFNQTLSGEANSFLPILSYINPNDIASIEILKDAGATAIYGSRASNGVVLITTRRGQAQPDQVTFDTYFGVQEVPRQIPLLNASEYAGLVNEALQQQGEPVKYTREQIQALGQGTNWQDEIFRVAPIQNYHLSYAGGSRAHRFYTSAGYLNQQGIIRQSGLQRYHFRLNYDGQIGKNLKIGLSSFLTDIQNQPNDPELIYYTLLAPPVFKSNDASGNFINPVKMLQYDSHSEKGQLLWGNIFAEYQIIPGLFVKAHYGLNLIKQKSKQLSYSRLSDNIRRTDINDESKSPLVEATLSYRRNWQQHTFFLISGFSGQQRENNYTSKTYLTRQGTDFNEFQYASNWNKNKLISYFGQIHYSFGNQYFLSASIRKDGSSQFGIQHKYTVLPAIAAAWQIINQQQTKQVIQNLKFRLSYGTTGHAPLAGLNLNSINVPMFSPDLHPELTRQINFGTDIELFSNRIQVSTDIYRKKTSDAIVSVPTPSNSGYSYIARNMAGLQNTGLEISINSRNIKGPLTWNSAFTFAANKNKITDLDNYRLVLKTTRNRTFIFSEGQSIGTINGLKTNGLYQNLNEVPNAFTFPGDVKYQDLNNDGDPLNDQTLLGSTHPTFHYSLNNDIIFKKIEVNLLLHGVQGNKIHNANRVDLNNFYADGSDNTNNGSRDLLQHWSLNQTNMNIPRLNGSYSNRSFSDQYVENGSFLRVRQITFAYNLPQQFTISNKMLQAKVYISGQNLFTFTKYTGYDPEVGGLYPVEQGLDFYNYPIPRTYLAGIQITW